MWEQRNSRLESNKEEGEQRAPPRGLEVGGCGVVVDAIAVEGRVVPLALRERGGP